MANEIDQVDEDLPEIQETDTTDWKTETFKLREKAIRQREKTKVLRDSLKVNEVRIADMEKELEKLRQPEKEKKSDEFGLLEKAFLRSAGYSDSAEIDLFRKWQKETGKSLDELIEHPFIKTEIENLRTAKANAAATDKVRGEAGVSGAKDTPEYWIAKGELPEKNPENRKLRADIAKKMMEQTKGGKKFYNE